MSALGKSQDIFTLKALGEFFVVHNLPRGQYQLDVSEKGEVKISRSKKYFVNKEDLEEISQNK